MFSHYPYYDELVDKLMGGDFTELQREAWVWMEDRFIPYPVPEQHPGPRPPTGVRLRQRPDQGAAREQAVLELQGVGRLGDGAGIAEHFMIPDNFKVWATPRSS
jgi:hypothetical protein